MKTQRLDWMKFFVADFMTSEAVDVMNDAEVGQYCLLMFTAWLGGKDCTLPNDPRYLAKHARCERVSDAVMAKFTLTPEGRLVNEVQQKNYREQVGFYAAASEAGKKGNEKRWGKKAEQGLDNVPATSEEGDREAIAARSGPNRDMNRCDENGIEKNGKERQDNAMHLGNGNVLSSILSANGNSKARAVAPPTPLESPSPVSVPETTPVPSAPSDEVMYTPKAAHMAKMFYSYLPPEQAKVGTPLAVEYMGEQYPVTVAAVGSTPLFDPDNSRMKA